MNTEDTARIVLKQSREKTGPYIVYLGLTFQILPFNLKKVLSHLYSMVARLVLHHLQAGNQRNLEC